MNYEFLPCPPSPFSLNLLVLLFLFCRRSLPGLQFHTPNSSGPSEAGFLA